jgi:hypothetical protein
MGIRERFSILWNYILISFLFDILISIFLKRVLHTSYGWAGNLFVIFEFILISIFYNKEVFKRNWFYLVAAVPLIFFMVNTFWKGFEQFNFFGASIFSFIYILYGIAGFYHILKTQTEPLLEQSRFFWVNVAIIIYPSGNFLLMLFKDYLKDADELLLRGLWLNFFAILNISKNFLLGIAFKREKPAV